MPIATVNPATGETIRVFEPLSAEELEARLVRAVTAFRRYRLIPFAARREKMLRLGELFEQDQERLGRLMTLEMGKPIQQARDEAVKCAAGCRYFAEYAEILLAEEKLPDAGRRCSVRFEPLGVVLASMPWNFPFWQVVRFAAPALMAGNAGLLKHAECVPQCGLALEELFLRAGFEPGCFQNLALEREAATALIGDPRIAAVTLTGSVAAGRAIGAEAGRHLKPCVLELGGSDPFLVMPGAPLAETVARAVKARVQNNGQSCIAAKRFVVHEAIYEEFARLFTEAFRALRMGDPLLPETEIGPLVQARAVETLERQVRGAVKAGGRILVGGERGAGPGFYFQPTILANVPPESSIAREEFFGPVALLFRARDLDHALALANDSPFGLGASIWTRDPAEQERAIAELEAGQVFVNTLVASQPALPFGGIKDSGFGRELGRPGIRSFVNAKSVCVAE
jgi:succinate-semialdehyde dehydrogenase/glutarate-semialdehyde dehydrogenase